jgi:hypothetical protein
VKILAVAILGAAFIATTQTGCDEITKALNEPQKRPMKKRQTPPIRHSEFVADPA